MRTSTQNKLELVTGIPVSNQALSLYDAEEDTQPVAVLDDDDKLLGYYSVRDWQFLKVCPHPRGSNPFHRLQRTFRSPTQILRNIYRSTQ
jgi:hypothetical protein